MTTPLTPDLIRRLAFVRYLLGVGIDQSRRPDPLAAVALLTLHDAAEMFLQIVAEHQNASDQERNFIAYWNKLEKKGVRLSHRVAMERLNAARVNLKHRGVSPSHADIEGFRETVSSFLLENAKEVLGIDFDRLSLTHLLKSDTVRQLLEAAEAALTSGDLQTAMSESAQAFTPKPPEFQCRVFGDDPVARRRRGGRSITSSSAPIARAPSSAPKRIPHFAKTKGRRRPAATAPPSRPQQVALSTALMPARPSCARGNG
jgi:hypothetical protein